MSPGARRPDYLVLACRAAEQLLRSARRMAKQDPHIFGPRSQEYFLDTLAEERRLHETEAAIRRVYGPRPPDEPKQPSTLWTDRYFPEPHQRRQFLKWFREKYPSR